MILGNGWGDSREAMAAAQHLSFVATKWDGPEEKMKCYNWLKKFMLAGCPKKMWRKGAYNWLYLHLFGHIAHYNMYGFWETWFEREHTCHKWVDDIARRDCYGDPTWTWSDVEVAIKNWLKNGNLERVHAAIRGQFLKEMARAEQAKITQVELWGGL